MTEHALDDLIRSIDPDSFSEAVHGSGHRIVLTGEKARFFEATFLGRLFPKRDEVHYFVKKLSVPKEVRDWVFHWSEGTSAISLDFACSLVLQANEDVQALKLVEALRGGSSVGEVLYGMINARLHQELERLLRDCDSKASSLLDCFRRSSAGLGESEDLNRRVSESVARALGGAVFRIGFQLKNAPPMQIEVRQTDDFTLADSKQVRKAVTTALLHMDNYQAYKKSGLETEEAVRRTVGRAITQAVKQLLFAGKYYGVVRSFSQGADSIEAQMLARIRQEALSIGYRVEMFQTYPDIAALKLLDPLRIDIPAGDDKYYLVNSTGYVQVGVALSVRVEKDFSRLHLLIDPDAVDVAGPIVEQAKRICRDTIQRFGRMEFNLSFDETVVPALKTALVEGLGSYGLSVQVVHVVQAPTEDAQRFMALRGRTIDYALAIDPQADAGDADAIQVSGKVEVTGMADQGWERFEAKDFGYRQDTHYTHARLRQMAAARSLPLTVENPLPLIDQHMLAIDLELHEIRDRVVSSLQEALSKVPDLAVLWRSMPNSQSILDRAQQIAGDAVAAEFGLSISLRGTQRGVTDGELTNTLRRRAKHDLLREQARADIEQEMAVRRLTNEDQLKLVQELGHKERNALDDELHEQHAEVRQRALRLSEGAAESPRLGSREALDVLPQRKTDQAATQLPWAAGSPAAPAIEPPTDPGPTPR